jgi:hypothetical protein
MDAAKDIVTKPFLSHVLKWEYWPYYLAAVALLVLLAILILIALRRRGSFARGRARIGKHLPARLTDHQKQIPRSSLRNVWKAFLKQVPYQFRRAIQSYRPFIVLGESGSGKSTLIDKNTDWRGQANRFYPSYAVDPLLQIYVGSGAVVMELPASLLNDTSRHARMALLKLWKPLFKKREASAVVVVNAAALLHELPEDLRRSAQTIRGKINILSDVQNKPARVSIVLSHMDQVEGYAQFADFLRKRKIPLHICPPAKAVDVKYVETCLEPYEAYLPQVLTSVSSDDYLRVVSFFKAFPEILSVVSSFAKVLQSSDPLSPIPQIHGLSLNSLDGNDAPGSNPFAYDLPAEPAGRAVPNAPHRFAAAVILALGMLYLGANYYGERMTLIKAEEILEQIKAYPLHQYNEYSHRLFMEVSADMKQSLGLALPPRFFPRVQELVRKHMAESIREFYLLPAFKSLGSGEDALERSIYLLGLIHATNNNDLGKLVLANIGEWQKALDLPSFLVTDYVNNNEGVEDVGLDVSALTRIKPKGIGLMEDALSWLVFLKRIKKGCDEPSISREYLHAIQKEADSFLRIVERAARYKLTNELVAMLRRLTLVGSQITWIQKRDVQLAQEGLRELLLKIKEQDIVYPPVAGLGLSQFIENIKVMTRPMAGEDKQYKVTIEGETFELSSASWSRLIMRSRISLFLREFVARNKRTDGMLFFAASEGIGFPDLVLNPSNDGLLFFVGKGTVDGKLTRSAFEQQVKPVLNEMPDIMSGLPVVDEEKTRFSNFILKQAEAYADRYVASYRSYYSQLRLSADSLGGLRYLLKQIQLPTSPFQDFLTTIKDNTVLDVGESPFLRQFAQKLGVFEFIRRLMTEKDGAFPELDKYKAILQQMDEDIDSNDTFAAKNKADDSNELKSILSPIGRISLAIQRGEDDSYSNLVRMWLKSVGMDAEWQRVFLDPVTIAFFLGRSDVETSVDRVWSDLQSSYLQPLYSKFPFSAKAEHEITPPELERILHPQGAFWKTFRDYIGPICQEASGVWTERVSAQGVFRIPDGMLESVNELSDLTSDLWTDKGVAQPIVLQIRPSGLPPRTEFAPIAILSYLRCDKASVFAFNQQPTWQKIEIEWWKAQTSAAGVELQSSHDAGKSYREVSIPEKFWSFYYLLQRSESPDKNVFAWRIAGPPPQQQQVRIDFTLKSDPWEVFRLKSQ